MFSIGISEVLLVIVVGCLVTDPKKLPGLLKSAVGYYRKFDEVRTEVLDSFKEVFRGSTVVPEHEDVEKHATKQIIGDDGMVYEAYEVGELAELKKNKKVTALAENTENLHNRE